MNIIDLYEDDTIEKMPAGYETEKDDNTTLKLSDLRKTKLTLAQINRLRIMNDVRALEHEQKLKTVKKQYKMPAPDMSSLQLYLKTIQKHSI